MKTHTPEGMAVAAIMYCLFAFPLLTPQEIDFARDNYLATECDCVWEQCPHGIEYIGEPCLSEVFWHRLLSLLKQIYVIYGKRNISNALLHRLDYVRSDKDGHTGARLSKSMGAIFVIYPQGFACRDHSINDPIPVFKFLSRMLPGIMALQLRVRPDLHRIRNSFVCCTSTIQCKGALTKERVLDAFQRRALLCLNDDSAIDHVIPVIMTEPRSEGSESEFIKADLSTVGIIPIRIEVCEDGEKVLPSSKLAAIGDEIIQAAQIVGFSPSLSIIINIGGSVTRNLIRTFGSLTVLVVDGESSPVFNRNDKEIISRFKTTCRRIKRHRESGAPSTAGT